MSAEASWYWTGLRTFPVLSLRCVLSASWCWIALFACCSVSCLRFVLLSYVSQWRLREQRSWSHSELGVADRSEGDIIKRSWCCSWLAWLRYLLRLSCCDHVLMLCLKHWTWCCEWFHAYVVWLSCHGMWWRPGKKLRRHLSLSSLRTSGKSDAMIGDTLHFHDMIVNLYRTFYTFEIIRMDQTLKGGQRSLWWRNCESCSFRMSLTASSLSVPTLASLDPRCERFSFRLFWIHLQWLWKLLAEVLNLRIAWVILIHFLFLLIRLPSLRRCGLAETVGLWFCVDSNRATSVFVLGLVCVCVCCCCCFVCCRMTTAP